MGSFDRMPEDASWRMGAAMDQSRVYEDSAVDWEELSRLYRMAPLGEKSPKDLNRVLEQ